jgi:hypothetical protein
MEFDWVTARSECSLKGVFRVLAEVIKTDAQKASNAVGRTFGVTEQDTKIIVSCKEDGLNVVFELVGGEIRVRKGTDRIMFSARPTLDDEGNCLLQIEDTRLRLWQVSRRGLEDLFFAGSE